MNNIKYMPLYCLIYLIASLIAYYTQSLGSMLILIGIGIFAFIKMIQNV